MARGNEAEAQESFDRALELTSDVGVSISRLKIAVREKRKP